MNANAKRCDAQCAHHLTTTSARRDRSATTDRFLAKINISSTNLSHHRPTEIKVYGATTQQRLHEDYPSNFWFGKQTKAGFTLNLVRIIVLCQSVYCAVLMVVFAEQMFESPGHCKAAQAAMLCDTSDATGLVYLARRPGGSPLAVVQAEAHEVGTVELVTSK